MYLYWLGKPGVLPLMLVMLLLGVMVACGSSATSTPEPPAATEAAATSAPTPVAAATQPSSASGAAPTAVPTPMPAAAGAPWLDFTQNLEEAMDAIALARRHLWLALEGFSLSAADPDIQKLPVALYYPLADSLAYAA